MRACSARIAGVGFWSDGLPDWPAARDFAAGGALSDDAARKPSPRLLPPNERRRAPESVAVALQVALAACEAAGRDPKALPSVFASGHGDFAITDYMCETLASEPRAISPTRFHNSVHNAAAGYWTIGTGCMMTTTAISAGRATFAEGLLEALVQLDDGADAVLLVAYDTTAVGPLAAMSGSRGLLGGALVLASNDDRGDTGPRLRATLVDATAPAGAGPLASLRRDNAMAPMLPLFDALAARDHLVLLDAGPGRALRVEIDHA
ncbi:beta-ketoacyl synthase chain length factor [Luteimonas salinilitoris]|uniref:Beta-ketoacyl synthase chain length factor n=1 Tax=Luteimonas salinilitoris TaxID=3237697 RepID=A0ABV4HQ77_9GAMM